MAQRRPATLRLIIAAAGYGKTSALRRMFGGPATRWVQDCDVDALVAGGLAELAAGAGQVVLDGVPALSEQRERELFRAVDDLPVGVGLAVSSRWPLGPAAGQWSARTAAARTRPADLALSADAIAELLRTEYGLSGPGLADRVWTATAGWPALVKLVAETLLVDGVPNGPLLPAVTEPGGPVAGYVTAEVLDGLTPDARSLLHMVTDLAPVTAGLCSAIGLPLAARDITTLVRTGLLTRVGVGPDAGPVVVPVVAAVAGHGRSPVATATVLQAAAWYRGHGPPRAAALAFRLAGDAERVAEVLHEHGDRMLVTGRPAVIAELVAGLPHRLRTRRLRLLAGDALRTAGEVAAAAEAYRSVADDEPAWDPGIAWRMGLIHYLRGDQRAALADFARGDEAAGPLTDQAVLAAWTAVATARSGDAAAGVDLARRAFQTAARSGQDSALATAHISLALCLGLTGDEAGSEEHHLLALRIAERTQDLVLLARILVNQSYHLVEQARYPQALEVAGRAAGYAEAAGHANLSAMAGGNEADALAMLGRYDEAAERYARALSRHRQMGSRISAAVHLGLGEVHLMRGWREQARAAFGDALRLSDDGDSRELAVRALAGLARALLPDDPDAATGYAERAAGRATDDVRIPALLAQGWVAVAGNVSDRARRLAGEAAELARTSGRRAGLARALELRAAAETDPDRRHDALREAYAIWADAGAVAEAARILSALSQLPGAGVQDRLAALLAVEGLPAGSLPDRYVPAARDSGPKQPGVLVRTLGRFEVQIAGCAVPPAAWQSRRARELLRILVSRRGRPVPRAELCELLWADDDPARTAHRLSVLLSIVRGVLDPDRVVSADHYLVTDAASVALDVTHLRVDVLEFLGAVAHGRYLLHRGAGAEARTVLTAAVDDYRADVFEDEPYVDWAGPLREQARAAYISALRLLADHHQATRAVAAAVDCLLRLLEKDPYDEPAHRALVRTLVAGGQHGEARRALARYREAMRAIGVRPPDLGMLLTDGAAQ